MTSKPNITRESITNAAIEVIRRDGYSALNARSLARELNCSTQPIYNKFASMAEITDSVVVQANRIYENFIAEYVKSTTYPPYKASGIAYIEFAKREHELFKLLFMRDRKGNTSDENEPMTKRILELISKSTGLSIEQAYLLHLEMWIYVHGIATMSVTSYLDWDMQTVSDMLTDVYMGLKQRFLENKSKTQLTKTQSS